MEVHTAQCLFLEEMLATDMKRSEMEVRTAHFKNNEMFPALDPETILPYLPEAEQKTP